MAEAGEPCEADLQELLRAAAGGPEGSSAQDEAQGLDDFPPSLLSFIEISESRAAVHERLILEELEDLTASLRTEDTINLPIELDKDVVKLKEHLNVFCDTGDEEDNNSTDSLLHPAPTDMEELLNHSVSVCPENKDEAGAGDYMESQKHLTLKAKTPEISSSEEERRKHRKYEAEQEKGLCEKMKRQEQRRQVERDFQMELRKIVEAEKLHQREYELMGRRAQEKLDREFLLQQELISNLQRRVEEERKMREEEQKKMKDEEDRRKREEEMKLEAERKRMEEEETRRREKEARKLEEVKLKKEEERKKEEEEKRRMEREEKMRREEERIKMDLEKKKLEDDARMKEEEKRKRKEELERMKKEEEYKRKREEEKIKTEAEKQRIDEEMRRKEEEGRKIEEVKLKKEEERKKQEEEKKRIEREEKRVEEERHKVDLEKKKLDNEVKLMKEKEKRKKKEEANGINTKEWVIGKREGERRELEEARNNREKDERKMKQEISLKEEVEEQKEEMSRNAEKNMRRDEKRRIIEEDEKRGKQEEIRRKKEEAEHMSEEAWMRVESKNGNVDDKKEEEKKKREEEEEDRNSEMKRKKTAEKTGVKEVVGKLEVENRNINEARGSNEKDEMRKKEVEEKTNKEEQRRRGEGETKRQRDEDGHDKSEEELRLTSWYDSKMGNGGKTKEKEGKEEKRKREDEWKNGEKEKEQSGDEVGENKEEVSKIREDVRFKEKEEREKSRVQDMEEEVGVMTLNELPEKRDLKEEIGQNKKNYIDKSAKSLIMLESNTTLTSSSPGPLLSESTTGPSSIETEPPPHDPDKIVSRTPKDESDDCVNPAPRPSSAPPVSPPVWLPEHTEQKRLSWMKDCIPWSKLSHTNRRKQKGPIGARRGPRRAAEASGLPPLCPDTLLRATGWKSLQEMTTVTLEDLPGCSLSTLAQCTQLRSLSLRRCGLRSLEGISQLPQLCYIDVQENDISFVDCHNMTRLRVLQLGHNKLTSIHGLTGAENLDVLDLSHNSITRIAGLESVRRLQRLSVDHNQLISTKGLRDVYTLLHLSCSHNHLASVEGLENNALLHTLDLRANSLTEPPSLKNQVLLRELHLDDNSISSLQGLAACWLPLMEHLSLAQNRITQLPSMSDSVSLQNLDLRFNCISELQNLYEGLEGCPSLQEVHLTGNPLQQESGWRAALQKAVPSLSAIDVQETESFPSPGAVRQVSLASGSFLTFCQAQLQQTRDLQQRHSKELRDASSSLDAVQTSCRHFSEALQLATDQRFAHEYGDTSVADRHTVAGHIVLEDTPNMDRTDAEMRAELRETESAVKALPVNPSVSYRTVDEKSAEKRQHDSFDSGTAAPKTAPTLSKDNPGSTLSLETTRETISSKPEVAPVSNHQHLNLQNSTAAVVIQQLWRKHRQKCGNISSPSTAEKGGGRGGDGRKPESGPPHSNARVVGQDHAATVIQALWRGFILRRRLASALAAVTRPDAGEDDTFEEVDVDEFVCDEAELEKDWILPLSYDSVPRRYPLSEQPLCVQPPGSGHEQPPYILPAQLKWRPKQAWVAGEQVESVGQTVPPLRSRNKSPASTSRVSERSEKILEEWGFSNSNTALLLLKRAQNMRPKGQQQGKHRDPSVRPAPFRNYSYQLGPAEARRKQAQHNRNNLNVGEAGLGLQQTEGKERGRQQLTQTAQSDRDSESPRFLPEISSDLLSGGRVQLVADPGYTELLHHASGSQARSRLAAQPCKENSYPRRNSLGAREELPSPKRVTSAPSKKERISFRDNPVQMSAGWGGGKKRDKVYK